MVETIPYTYDSTWKDKLTSYGGVTIQSDALGNVTSDGTWTYTWEGGRRLAGMSKSGTTISFKYDENGQRIKKVVNGVTTEYTVQGKRVVHVKNDSLGQLHIYYDGNRPDMVTYNGATYRYVHSLQGDILGLQNGTGAFVVEYRYDAWGRQISKTGSLAATLGTLNPFRYRGYVYDEETGLYYLRSRYYNPNWCRFISSDSILGRMGGLLQHNLWAYCVNDAINATDPSGLWSISWEERWNGFLCALEFWRRMAVAIIKAVSIEAGFGVGIGGEFSTKVYGNSVSAGAGFSITDSVILERGQFDIRNTTSARAGCGMGIFGVSMEQGVSHSYYDDACECSFWTTTSKEKRECPANTKIDSYGMDIEISVGVYCLLGGEITLGIDTRGLLEDFGCIYRDTMKFALQ